MDLFEGIKLFVHATRVGNFSVVARDFGLSQPSVSKKIAGLERELGTRLFSRSTRHLRLTEEGAAYLKHAQKIVDELAEADAALGRSKSVARGLVRIGCPYAFARRYLVRRIAHLLKAYPELRVEIISSDEPSNMVEQLIDVAIRFGEPRGDIIARKVGVTSRIAVASTSYLNAQGTPSAPIDLGTHNCLVYENPIVSGQWIFSSSKGTEVVAPRGNFKSNSAEVIREACLQGIGVTLMPNWLFHDDLFSGTIQQVLQEYEPEGLPIYVTYPTRKFVAPKIQAVVEYLCTELSNDSAFKRQPPSSLQS